MNKLENSIEKLNVCLVIPTYNHASFLGGVIDDCLQYPIDIVVVNDGSTDNTLSILEKYAPKISIVSYEKNKGKPNRSTRRKSSANVTFSQQIPRTLFSYQISVFDIEAGD
jgi:cellulose synthase/poly-beta-1,6-N-acetylglucosamine synthase-like glycosyltransferase